jgi:cobalamin biosynthesis Mg chelatase CobN
MRNVMLSGNSTPVDPANYSPSVPISLYRELSAELETTKAQLDTLSTHNQHLTRENQQLRKEIDQLVQSAYRLQQVVTSFQPYTQPAGQTPPNGMPAGLSSNAPLPHRHNPISSSNQETDLNNPFPMLDPENSVFSGTLFTEEQVRPRRSSKPQRSSDMGGVWLAITIFLIVVAAFGAGYWIVRPILLKR